MWFPESPVAHPQALRGLPPPAQWEAFFLRSERERDVPCVPGRFLVGPRGGRARGVGPGWSPVSGTLPGSRSLTTTGQSQHWGQLCPGGCAPEPSQWPEGPTPAPGSGTSCLRVAVCPTRGPDVTPSPPLLLQAPSTSRCPHVPGWSGLPGLSPSVPFSLLGHQRLHDPRPRPWEDGFSSRSPHRLQEGEGAAGSGGVRGRAWPAVGGLPSHRSGRGPR